MRSLASIGAVLLCLSTPLAAQAPTAAFLHTESGWPGRHDGTWHWLLPDTPNGLHPTQSWHATGSAPNGDIYVGGMDHVTNSALYRLKAEDGTLALVGDAWSASEAARNWAPGETAQKFHTRPLWHRGKIYVATMDRSVLDEGYRTRRGFHWYAYDPAVGSFTDLSASEPGGSAVPHGNVVTLASDPERNVVYGAGVPTGEIYRYDVASGRTDNLGRPSSYQEPYVYTGRVMWVDTRGRLYFTASRADGTPTQAHIHYYDPVAGFGEEKGWHLKDGQALEVGQCLAGGRQCVFSDDRGHVYRFDEVEHSWVYLGKIAVTQADARIWLFALAADGKTAYVATSTSPQPSETTALYAFDLSSGTTQRLCALADLDPALEHLHVHTGYNAWDKNDRFYFASFGFSERSLEGVVVTRVDPGRLKSALAQGGREHERR
ncbi:hypothetical protein [Methylobacterium oxalidis]|uniref:hypothetical protein n=1 Tax=Methylobacterium oxalidis TaxID=944322 RepID=UPI0033158E86